MARGCTLHLPRNVCGLLVVFALVAGSGKKRELGCKWDPVRHSMACDGPSSKQFKPPHALPPRGGCSWNALAHKVVCHEQTPALAENAEGIKSAPSTTVNVGSKQKQAQAAAQQKPAQAAAQAPQPPTDGSPGFEKTGPVKRCNWTPAAHKLICHAISNVTDHTISSTESCESRTHRWRRGLVLGGDRFRYPLRGPLQAQSKGEAFTEVNLVYTHLHGHVDHYYHFVHDALLTFYPIYVAFRPRLSVAVLWRQSFAHLTPIFEAVYAGVRVEQTACKCDATAGLCAEITSDRMRSGSLNLDSSTLDLYPFYFDDAVAFVASRMAVTTKLSPKLRSLNSTRNAGYIKNSSLGSQPEEDDDETKGLIVLIEREGRGEGASRSIHIVNHADLLLKVVSKFGGSKRVRNVMLASLTFGEQVQLFSTAEVIIGQHGAGLVNILFALPGSFVLELCPRLHMMYETIATKRKLEYSFQDDCKNQPGNSHLAPDSPGPIVDIEMALRDVERYFKSPQYHTRITPRDAV